MTRLELLEYALEGARLQMGLLDKPSDEEVQQLENDIREIEHDIAIEHEGSYKSYVHVADANIRPEVPQTDHCPDHPDAPLDFGYGLAGGGMGGYMYCTVCGNVISKSQDPF